MIEILECGAEQRDELIDFLKIADTLLPRPISDRIGLALFADKVLANGKISAAVSDGRIIGAAFFYCNDNVGKIAYFSVLAVLPEGQGTGVGSRLISEVERISRENGMETVRLKANVTNTRAVEFYKKKGYSIAETVVDGEETKHIFTKRII